MRTKTFSHFIAITLIATLSLQACKDDSNLTTPLPLPDKSFTESFDNYAEAYAKGWRSINTSTPNGRKWYDIAEAPNMGSVNYVSIYYPGWEQAQFSLDSLQFPTAPYPQRYWKNAFYSQRASNGYVASSIASAEPISLNGSTDPFTVSCWLVSPEQQIKNGDRIVFYSYCKDLCRMQVWINKKNTLSVGSNAATTGDFDIKLLDINSGYDRFETNPAKAYPTEWTRFEAEVKGLTEPVIGRFAFRYLLQTQPQILTSVADPTNYDTLYTQIHKTVVGIDELNYISAK
ncbi:MAG: hypothetical protein RL172_2613 [Bacteroidota bacterium]|jgi:hypothetical protein